MRHVGDPFQLSHNLHIDRKYFAVAPALINIINNLSLNMYIFSRLQTHRVPSVFSYPHNMPKSKAKKKHCGEPVPRGEPVPTGVLEEKRPGKTTRRSRKDPTPGTSTPGTSYGPDTSNDPIQPSTSAQPMDRRVVDPGICTADTITPLHSVCGDIALHVSAQLREKNLEWGLCRLKVRFYLKEILSISSKW